MNQCFKSLGNHCKALAQRDGVQWGGKGQGDMTYNGTLSFCDETNDPETRASV
jgi:hypothetical protein